MKSIFRWINPDTCTPLGGVVFVLLYAHVVVFGIWGLWIVGTWIYESDYLLLKVSAAITLFVALACMNGPGPD